MSYIQEGKMYMDKFAAAQQYVGMRKDLGQVDVPNTVREVPRLDAIANQYEQVFQGLQVLTTRVGNVADRLMGTRPVPSRAESDIKATDGSALDRLQRHGRELSGMLDLLAHEIGRLEEL